MERDILGKATVFFAKGSDEVRLYSTPQTGWPIRGQCRVLLVSISGYHQHLARRVHIAQRRHLNDEALLVHISTVQAENRGAYDWPRI
jgi:aminopeptidase-like protein